MPSYIVVTSPSYGGAEKRFFDIFRSLRRSGADVVLIAPSTLTQLFLADHEKDSPELAPAMLSLDLPAWSRRAFIGRFRRLLSKLPRGSSFHYPMNCLWPLHLGRGDRLSMSVTNCISVPGPLARRHTGLWTWLSFFFVDHIDVLSPTILKKMSGYRMSYKMSLTPGGTFLEPHTPTGLLRQPVIVMIGRLIPTKGFDDFLDVLPQVWSILREKSISNLRFEIAGYGPLQENLISRIEKLSTEIPISFVGYADAPALFSRSAVALSLQEITNYPSRVVAEALVSGCSVIVRNTGDSMLFGKDALGLEYCRADLDSNELAVMIFKLVDLVMRDDVFSSQISSAAIERFNSKSYTNYYRNIVGS